MKTGKMGSGGFYSYCGVFTGESTTDFDPSSAVTSDPLVI